MRERILPPRNEVLAALAVGVAAAFLGPFGTTESLGLGWRLLYWPGTIVSGWVAMSCAMAWSERDARLRARPVPVRLGLVILGGAVPLALALFILNHWVFGQRLEPGQLGLSYLQVVLVNLLILVPLHLILARDDRPAPDPAAASPETAMPPMPATPQAAEPAFLRRLSAAHQGAALLALQMEDHYLRVHTDRGSDLILYRMADAVADLPEARGWRVHRSWWVAADAIQAVRWDKGRAALALRNGLEVPVSRATLPTLRDRLRALPQA